MIWGIHFGGKATSTTTQQQERTAAEPLPQRLPYSVSAFFHRWLFRGEQVSPPPVIQAPRPEPTSAAAPDVSTFTLPATTAASTIAEEASVVVPPPVLSEEEIQTQALVEVLDGFEMLPDLRNTDENVSGLFRKCHDEKEFHNAVHNIHTGRGRHSNEKIEAMRQCFVKFKEKVEELEANSVAVNLDQLAARRDFGLIFTIAKDVAFLNKAATALKSKVLSTPVHDNEDISTFMTTNFFINHSNLYQIIKNTETSKEELFELMRHIYPGILFAGNGFREKSLTAELLRTSSLQGYRQLLHDVLSSASEQYLRIVMDGFVWNVNSDDGRPEILATRLAWALHEDRALVYKLCTLSNVNSLATKDANNVAKLLSTRLEHIRRYQALIATGAIEDHAWSSLQNEYGCYEHIPILSLGNRPYQQHVTRENAHTIMRGHHWTAILKNPQVFVEHGQRPRDEVFEQMTQQLSEDDWLSHVSKVNLASLSETEMTTLARWMAEASRQGITTPNLPYNKKFAEIQRKFWM